MPVSMRDVPENGHRPDADLPPPGPRRLRPGPDWSLLLIKLGGWVLVGAFGGLFWLVNGGFSVRGLEEICAQLGPGALLYWQAASATPLPVTFAVPGLPPTQPAIPWAAVFGISLVQIGIVWRGLQGKSMPVWVVIIGLLLSGYDLVTTFYGFGTLQWVQWAGWFVQGLLSLLFTFGLELLIGFLLRTRR